MAKKAKATTLYKLTDENCCTYGGCQWGENVTHTASGSGELCSSAWLHAYTHPVLAYMLNPIHAKFAKPRLWVCEGIVGATNRGLKVGCTSLTTLRRLDSTPPTLTNRIAFAIGCAYNVYRDPSWVSWARAWVVEGKRATATAAAAAVTAAADAAAAAVTAAADAAAADAAAYAAAAAAAADSDADADAAARAARAAARAARAAARAAAYAADAAAYAADAAAAALLPLAAIADWAVTVK